MAGWHVLNTDASVPDVSGEAAIGVILRQKPRQNVPLRVIAYRSEMVGVMYIQQAEYRALIEGLKLANLHDPTNLQVFVDSAVMADQMNEADPKLKAYMKPLHAEARSLIDEIGEDRVRVSWLPRELNREADQRASDAFFMQVGKAWVGPGSKLMPK
jgi:ribonuclease HI